MSIERLDTIGEKFRLRNNETKLIILCSVQDLGYVVLVINLKGYSIKIEDI